MQPEPTDRLQFRGFVLDLRSRTLANRGREVLIRPKSFDVLAYLVRNAGRLIEKDEILEAVWEGVFASDESLARCISDARSAIGDDEKAIIRTVPGRGYQFTDEVELVTTDTRAPTCNPSRRSRRPYMIAALVATVAVAMVIWGTGFRDWTGPMSIRPSIVIVPLRNISADSAIDRFASGLTSDLNSALARVPGLLVIAESAAKKYAEGAVDAQQVARDTRVTHALSGTIQAEGSKLRISVQLAEGDSGLAIWSQRYDRGAEDFLTLQDDIVRQVIVALQIELTDGEAIRILSRGTDKLEAWLLSFEALSAGFEFKQESNMKARALYREASELDPEWAAPVAGLAWTYREALRRGWSTDAEADRARWLELAEQCRAIDPDFYGCYIQLGNYYIENDRIEEGIRLRNKALELAPNDLSVLSGLAWQLVLTGKIERGLELLNRAKQVSPFHPPWLIATEAYAYQIDGQYAKAIEGFKYALAHGDFPDWHARLAAVYAEAGDLENARAQAKIFMEKRPNRRVADLTRILKIQDPEQTAHYAEMLRRAGIPD